jgi:preprotein translocase subunit SecF
MHLFKNPSFDFLRWRWAAMALSSLVIIAGVVALLTRGLALGVEFSGGTIVVVRFESSVTETQVREATAGVPGDKVVQRFGDPSVNEWMVRLPESEEVATGGNLSADSQRIVQALEAADLPNFQIVSTEIVGPVVGAELQRRGIYATILSMVGITLYIAFRFRPSFAVGSLIATLHDVFVTLSFLVFFQYEMSLNVIAAMLTMVGYSVNDMIVIFDRVRENTRGRSRDPLEVLINTSLNQTLTRTVITSGTVFLAVLALFLFGGVVLRGFAFTMLVGTLATTYSGWFIAPSLAILLSSKGKGTPRAAVTAPREQPGPAPQQPTRKSKPTRKARAS